MWKALLWTFIALVFTVVSIASLIEGRAMDARGKTTNIERPEKITKETHKKRNRLKRITYSGEIQFVTESNESVTVKKSLPVELVEKIQRGEPVSIRYLPDKPTTTLLEGEKPARPAQIAIAFGVSFRPPDGVSGRVVVDVDIAAPSR